jgi:hypothetical protein
VTGQLQAHSLHGEAGLEARPLLTLLILLQIGNQLLLKVFKMQCKVRNPAVFRILGY